MIRLLMRLDRIRRGTETVYKTMVLICGFLLMLLMTGNVFVRIFPIASMHWFDEIVQLLFAWMVFAGSAVLYSTREHFLIDWLSRKTEGTEFGRIYRIMTELICLVFVLIFLFQSFRLTVLTTAWTSVFNIPKRILYASMPAAGIFMAYAGLLEILGSLTGFNSGQETSDPAGISHMTPDTDGFPSD